MIFDVPHEGQYIILLHHSIYRTCNSLLSAACASSASSAGTPVSGSPASSNLPPAPNGTQSIHHDGHGTHWIRYLYIFIISQSIKSGATYGFGHGTKRQQFLAHGPCAPSDPFLVALDEVTPAERLDQLRIQTPHCYQRNSRESKAVQPASHIPSNQIPLAPPSLLVFLLINVRRWSHIPAEPS